MAAKLYVGGLAYSTTSEGLREFFSQCGNVVSATVITDRFSGQSRGFGFVEMATSEGAPGGAPAARGGGPRPPPHLGGNLESPSAPHGRRAAGWRPAGRRSAGRSRARSRRRGRQRLRPPAF